MFKGKKKAAVRSNSNQTMTWKEKTSKNTRQSDMRESLYKSKSSLNAENMYQAVVLPNKPDYYVEDYSKDKEEVHEWWAENTVDFYNELCVLMGVLTENNPDWTEVCDHPETQPNKGYPKGVTYMWKATREAKPKELPVDVYMDHVIIWVNSQIENEDVFPTDEDVPFPDDFRLYARKMYKRMFRLFAIFYSNDSLYKRKVVENHLDTCFKHFLYFCWKWDLLDANETKCVDPIISPFRKKFNRDQKLYFDHKLPITQGPRSAKGSRKGGKNDK